MTALLRLDNVIVASRRGRLGNPLGRAATPHERSNAEALLSFVGYQGALATPAQRTCLARRRPSSSEPTAASAAFAPNKATSKALS